MCSFDMKSVNHFGKSRTSYYECVFMSGRGGRGYARALALLLSSFDLTWLPTPRQMTFLLQWPPLLKFKRIRKPTRRNKISSGSYQSFFFNSFQRYPTSDSLLQICGPLSLPVTMTICWLSSGLWWIADEQFKYSAFAIESF